MEEIIKILERLFPDRYEIEDKKIILYYPKLIIKANNGKEHPIFDMFVQIVLNKGIIERFLGLRTTYSDDEWVSTFTHPFLSHRCFTWGRFCLGRSVINTYIGEKITPELFEILLYDLNAYLTYGSSNANPYKRLTDIVKGTQLLIPRNIHYNKSLANFRKKANISKLKLQFDNKVKLVKNDYLINLLEECVTLKGYVIGAKCYNSLNVQQYPNEPSFHFKKREFKIKTFESEPKDNKAVSAHPTLITYIIKRFEEELNESLKTKLKHRYVKKRRKRNFIFI